MNKTKDKTILITGGTGFLGRHLALQLKKDNTVIIAGRNNKQNAIASKITGCQSAPLDIVNIESVRDIFTEFKPDIVIHAAATKFVDLAEKYPMECVDVNVLGSQNICRVATEKEVEIVIGGDGYLPSGHIRSRYLRDCWQLIFHS